MTPDSNEQPTLRDFFSGLDSAAQDHEADTAKAVDKAKRELAEMFRLLEPSVTAAVVAVGVMERRAREAEERRTSRNFSAFEVARTQEIDLSRIFEALLDPRGNHAQGSRFLSLLLEELQAAHGSSVGALKHFRPPASSKTRVHREYGLGEQKTNDGQEDKPKKRVDLLLEFEGNRWIGIENKPWPKRGGQDKDQQKEDKDQQKEDKDQQKGDKDQNGDKQVSVYLKRLDHKARHPQSEGEGPDGATPNVVFLYWSGDGHPPPDLDDLNEDERHRCLTVPYRRDFRRASVEGWLLRCRAECESKRVRRFLKDVLAYIRNHFPLTHPTQRSWKPTMSNKDVTVQAAQAFLVEKHQYFPLALAVEKAVRQMRGEARQKFHSQLSDEMCRLKERVSQTWMFDDKKVGTRSRWRFYREDKNWTLTASSDPRWDGIWVKIESDAEIQVCAERWSGDVAQTTQLVYGAFAKFTKDGRASDLWSERRLSGRRERVGYLLDVDRALLTGDPTKTPSLWAQDIGTLIEDLMAIWTPTQESSDRAANTAGT